MRGIMKIELKRAFINTKFYIVVFVSTIFAIGSFFTTPGFTIAKNWFLYMNGDLDAIYMIEKCDYSDVAIEIWMPNYGASSKFYFLWLIILPLLCIIPYGITYIEDKSSGLINQYIIKIGKGKYYVSKFITLFISGGTIATLPLLINLIICSMALPFGLPVRSTQFYPVKEYNLFSNLYYQNIVVYLMLYFLIYFVVYGLITCLALSFVYFEENKYMLLLVPFIIYFSEHVIISFGFNRHDTSLLLATNIINLRYENLLFYLLQIIVLFLFDVLFFFRIRRDVI